MNMTLKELVEHIADQNNMRKRDARKFLLAYIWLCLFDSERERITEALLRGVKNKETRWDNPPPLPKPTPDLTDKN